MTKKVNHINYLVITKDFFRRWGSDKTRKSYDVNACEFNACRVIAPMTLPFKLEHSSACTQLFGCRMTGLRMAMVPPSKDGK